ncbi:MAG: alpha/beta fold hydrolase, partial [Actinomycetota bacterium]
KTWHESWGSGPPLVLLHGGLGASVEWEYYVPILAQDFTVHVFDRRGHGRTEDPGPMSYELMAEDAVHFVETVVGAPAHLVGWSDGGIVALMVAARRPDLVAKVVPISANVELSGVEEPIQQMFAATPADAPMFEPLASLHGELSPHGPEHWPVLFAKFNEMVKIEVILDAPALAGITAPTLVLASDDDMVTLEHTIGMFRAIPNAQLAIVPGTSHMLAMEKPELVKDLIRDFLRSEPAPTIMPIRRGGDAPHS